MSLLSLLGFVAHTDLHSFPTRRSSDLRLAFRGVSVQTVRPVQAAALPPEMERDQPRLLAARLDPLPRRSEEHTSNSSHGYISYAVFCLKKKIKKSYTYPDR